MDNRCSTCDNVYSTHSNLKRHQGAANHNDSTQPVISISSKGGQRNFAASGGMRTARSSLSTGSTSFSVEPKRRRDPSPERTAGGVVADQFTPTRTLAKSPHNSPLSLRPRFRQVPRRALPLGLSVAVRALHVDGVVAKAKSWKWACMHCNSTFTSGCNLDRHYNKFHAAGKIISFRRGPKRPRVSNLAVDSSLPSNLATCPECDCRTSDLQSHMFASHSELIAEFA